MCGPPSHIGGLPLDWDSLIAAPKATRPWRSRLLLLPRRSRQWCVNVPVDAAGRLHPSDGRAAQSRLAGLTRRRGRVLAAGFGTTGTLSLV